MLKRRPIYRTTEPLNIHLNTSTPERTAFTASMNCSETDFNEQLMLLLTALKSELESVPTGAQRPVWLRFYSTDSWVNFQSISQTVKESGVDCAVSVIRQEPLYPAVPVLVQGIASAVTPKQPSTPDLPEMKKLFPESSMHSWIEGEKEYILLTHLIAEEHGDSDQETEQVFDRLQQLLDKLGMPLTENGLRTWLYIKDIDNQYAGAVDARTRYFDKIGMKERFLVSTGIGTFGDDSNILTLDVLLCREHSAGQNKFIDSPDFMPHAASYGVTFERSLLHSNSTMKHLLIAGTASIDQQGEILYKGSPSTQTRRIFLILQDLLKQGDFKLDDMDSYTVYLRDSHELKKVIKVCQKAAGSIPMIFLHGPVCRPGWLVEIEGESSLPL